MARFRPKGSKSQRIMGRAVGKGLNAARQQNRGNQQSGCLTVIIGGLVVIGGILNFII